mmetsp:Transcript_37871/g.33887  ORF Transcript_37871/g.33887 Transcript_37871/m.33887 type:complete len:126 (+) Transcript_37871:199-576(+)
MKLIKETYSKDFLKTLNINIQKLALYPVAMQIMYTPQVYLEFIRSSISDTTYMYLLSFYNLIGFVNTLLYLYVRNIHTGNDMQSPPKTEVDITPENRKSTNRLSQGSCDVEMEEKCQEDLEICQD